MRSAAELLAIPLDEPERLFDSADESVIKLEYRKLIAQWHPDRHDGAVNVAAHLNLLYESALKKARTGTWSPPGVLVFHTRMGKHYRLRYFRKRPFELGTMYLGREHVAYQIERRYSSLVMRMNSIVNDFVYADNAMMLEHRRYLPRVSVVSEDKEFYTVVVKKEPDELSLRDVLEYFQGRLDPKHVAWILSRLYNIKAYLQWAGLVHHHISPDTVFINPATHVAVLLGGWWYAAREGQPITHVPVRTLTYGPSDLATLKRSQQRTDADLIRATGRELFGDIVGTRLSSAVPKAMKQWLRGAGTDDAFREYDAWYNKVLISSFGARRFTRLDLSASDIYKELL